MKPILLMFSLALIISGLDIQGQVTAEQIYSALAPIKLTISEMTGLSTGPEVRIKIVLTNISDHEITIQERRTECDYTVFVTNSDGLPIPEAEHKRQLKCSGRSFGGRNSSKTLLPGKSIEDILTVNALSDMSRPGEYIIFVERKLPLDLSGRVVKSNILHILVLHQTG